jgi:hypothetical protein
VACYGFIFFSCLFILSLIDLCPLRW